MRTYRELETEGGDEFIDDNLPEISPEGDTLNDPNS
jgi:hypothetical protein